MPKKTNTPPPAPAAKAPAKTTDKPTAKPKAAPKATKPAKTPEVPTAAKQAPETVPGVRPMRSRPYYAGVVIKKYGLAAGVTPAMVAEVDAAYGEPNPRESQFCLRNAWHACRAFAGAAEDAIA